MEWSFGHKAITDSLISKGMDVHVKDPQGYTRLYRDTFEGYVKITELFIQKRCRHKHCKQRSLECFGSGYHVLSQQTYRRPSPQTQR